MEILVAWAVYLSLGILCLALGWAWLRPRLPRCMRLAILWFVAGLSVLALALTAHLPQDYRPGDLAEYWRALAALITGLLIAIAGAVAALTAIGRRRTQNGSLFGIGVYLAGVGMVLYLMLDGQSTLHAPALLLVGATVAVAAALRLTGLHRWPARAIGLAPAPGC